MENNNTNNYTSIALSLLALVVTIVAAILLWPQHDKKISNNSVVEATGDEIPFAPEDLTGSLYLSMGISDFYVIDPYVMDVQSGAVYQEGIDYKNLAQFHSFAPNGEWLTFIGGDAENLIAGLAQEEPTDVYGVYRAPHYQDTLLPVTSSAEEVANLPSNTEMLPAISSDGAKVAFVEQNVSNGNEFSLTTRTIHLSQEDGSGNWNTAAITSGSYPTWVTDDVFLFISPEGLAYYSVSAAQATTLLPDVAASNIKLDVSDDGSLIALAYPDSESVFVFSVDDWSGRPELSEVTSVPISAFWAVFSPDNKYLALQTAETITTGDIIPKIQFYNLQTNELLELEYWLFGDNNQTFVTDWQS